MESREEEEALARRARAGDAGAFGDLYRRTWRTTLALAASRLADLDEARSVAQEAYARALAGIGGLKDPGAFRAFLRTIALRLVERARGRPPAGEIPAGLPDPAAPDPAREAERAEFERALAHAMRDFEPLHREATLLRLVEGLKYREIAERVGLRLDQASGIVERGILKLSERLRPFLKEGST